MRNPKDKKTEQQRLHLLRLPKERIASVPFPEVDGPGSGCRYGKVGAVSAGTGAVVVPDIPALLKNGD